MRTLAILLLAAGAAIAAESPAVERARAECKADVLRLCLAHVGIIPDIPAIVACLKKNEASLSVGCRDALLAARKK